MSHTKGPWFTGVSVDNGIHCVDAFSPNGNKTEICEVWGSFFDKKETPESRANARLIAAAPDLLEFVQQIFNGIDTGNLTIETPADETTANVLAQGRAALSKATGAA